CSPPAETARKRPLPLSVCPLESSPQQVTSPVPPTPQLWLPPAETAGGAERTELEVSAASDMPGAANTATTTTRKARYLHVPRSRVKIARILCTDRRNLPRIVSFSDFAAPALGSGR